MMGFTCVTKFGTQAISLELITMDDNADFLQYFPAIGILFEVASVRFGSRALSFGSARSAR